MRDTRDVVKGIMWGYALCCPHCGKIAAHRFGVPPRVSPCRSCGRTMMLAVCTVTATHAPLELNGVAIAPAGANTSPGA